MKNSQPTASHLSAVFGLAEICAVLIGITDIPTFEKAWLQYCDPYNASAEEQRSQYFYLQRGRVASYRIDGTGMVGGQLPEN